MGNYIIIYASNLESNHYKGANDKAKRYEDCDKVKKFARYLAAVSGSEEDTFSFVETYRPECREELYKSFDAGIVVMDKYYRDKIRKYNDYSVCTAEGPKMLPNGRLDIKLIPTYSGAHTEAETGATVWGGKIYFFHVDAINEEMGLGELMYSFEKLEEQSDLKNIGEDLTTCFFYRRDDSSDLPFIKSWHSIGGTNTNCKKLESSLLRREVELCDETAISNVGFKMYTLAISNSKQSIDRISSKVLSNLNAYYGIRKMAPSYSPN